MVDPQICAMRRDALITKSNTSFQFIKQRVFYEVKKLKTIPAPSFPMALNHNEKQHHLYSITNKSNAFILIL